MNNYEYPFPAGTVPVPVVNTLQSCVNTGDSNWPYFLDGTGIEHHVIQTDIPRYLGNDAQVKRGTHQGVDGFKFSGYRPLTSAMIRSLREDSSKWLKERQDYWRQTNQSGPSTYTPHSYYPSTPSSASSTSFSSERERESDKVRSLRHVDGWPDYYKSRTYDESLIRSPPVNYQQNQPPPASRATRGGGPPGDPGIPPSAPMGHGYQDAARYHGQQYEGRSGYPEPPYVDTYGRGGGSHARAYDTAAGGIPGGEAYPSGAEIPRAYPDPRSRGSERPHGHAAPQPEGYWAVDPNTGKQEWYWKRQQTNHD